MGSASRMAAVVIAAILFVTIGVCALQWLHGVQRHWREQQRDNGTRYGVVRVIRSNGKKSQWREGLHGVNADLLNAGHA
jgi:hypothetical protein